MHQSAPREVLAAFVDAPRSVSARPILVLHPMGDEDAEAFAGRLEGMKTLPPALQRASMVRERSFLLRAYAGVDARRLMGVWEPFGVERAEREGLPAKSASLPFDDGTAMGRLPDPRAWNLLRMRPVPREFLLRSGCESIETFREGRGGARIGWRFKVEGSNDWIQTPSFGADDLAAWSRRPRPQSFGDAQVEDALNLMIHTDADGGVEHAPA